MVSESDVAPTRAATMAAALVDRFGAEAITIAERQIAAATDKTVAAWKEITAFL